VKRLLVAIVVALAACGGTTPASAPTTITPLPAVSTVAPTTLAPTTTLPPTTSTPPSTAAPITEPATTTPIPTTPPPATTAAPATDPPTTAAPEPILLPNGTAGPTYSPGAILDVTVQQICTPGYASSVRAVTTPEKNAIYAEYGITNHTGYVIDHLVSLELGGSNDPSNLWPEPADEAKRKDRVENALHDALCSGQMSLGDAQAQIKTWWTAPSYSAAPAPTTPKATTPPAPKTTTPTSVANSGGGFTCVDGTHSNAAHRQGACSHHGGIAG
jgi:hypothetical protein